jgi:hypothetical protein
MVRNQLLLIFFLSTGIIYSQKLSIALSAGYNRGIGVQNLTSSNNYGLSQSSFEAVKGSLGQGFSESIYLDYILNPKCTADIGISYLQSTEYRGSLIRDTSYREEIYISAKMLKAEPSLKIYLTDTPNRSYVRLGAIVAIAGAIDLTNKYFDHISTQNTVVHWKYSGGFSGGVLTGVGHEVKIAERLTLFSEVILRVQSWAPKKGEVKSYTINGVDMTSTLLPNQNSISFYKSYTVTNGNTSSWTSQQQLKQYHSLSSIGLFIGLEFKFGKNKSETRN